MSNYYYKTTDFKFTVDKTDEQILAEILSKLKLPQSFSHPVANATPLGRGIYKKAIDARDKQNVKFVVSAVVKSNKKLTGPLLESYTPKVNIFDSLTKAAESSKIIICGSGPCGLFAALHLSKRGLKPLIIEKGADLPQRAEIVNKFFKTLELNENTNVQFGLGGAGTFSDGKLNTNTKDEKNFSVLSEFVKFGAKEEILYDSAPHIGTDNLQKIICNMRDEIIRLGGEFRFNASLNDIIIADNKVKAVLVNNEILSCDKLLLAHGHSAKNVYEILKRIGAEICSKPFAIGVRIEHNADFINNAQYGEFVKYKNILPADYKLVSHRGERAVYTFCMCPGGVVVPAVSVKNTIVTNGMSNSARSGENSNSALLVNVFDNDHNNDAFTFLEGLEKKAFEVSGSYKAPCQNAEDFINDKISQNFVVKPSCLTGVFSADLNKILPEFVCKNLKAALLDFNDKIKGFIKNGVLTGVETRTTAPVRVVRNNVTFESNIKGLYPSGEGAGYAGGIVSSAADGINSAMRMINDTDTLNSPLSILN